MLRYTCAMTVAAYAGWLARALRAGAADALLSELLQLLTDGARAAPAPTARPWPRSGRLPGGLCRALCPRAADRRRRSGSLQLTNFLAARAAASLCVAAAKPCTGRAARSERARLPPARSAGRPRGVPRGGAGAAAPVRGGARAPGALRGGAARAVPARGGHGAACRRQRRARHRGGRLARGWHRGRRGGRPAGASGRPTSLCSPMRPPRSGRLPRHAPHSCLLAA